MKRFIISGGCHVLCWVGECLLVALSPVAFEPYLHALLWVAIPVTLIWFLYDFYVWRKWMNTPFPNPAVEVKKYSDEIQRRRREEIQLRTAVRVNGL